MSFVDLAFWTTICDEDISLPSTWTPTVHNLLLISKDFLQLKIHTWASMRFGLYIEKLWAYWKGLCAVLVNAWKKPSYIYLELDDMM